MKYALRDEDQIDTLPEIELPEPSKVRRRAPQLQNDADAILIGLGIVFTVAFSALAGCLWMAAQ